jgi:hypothetical protein
MPGEETAPPAVLDEQTRSLTEGLVQSGVRAALALRAAGFPCRGCCRNPFSRDAVAYPQSAAAGTEGGFPAEARAGACGAGHDCCARDSEGDDSVGENRADSDGDSPDDGAAENSFQAFAVPWYEARRGESTAPRCSIPDRFDPRYPIGLEPSPSHTLEPSVLSVQGRRERLRLTPSSPVQHTSERQITRSPKQSDASTQRLLITNRTVPQLPVGSIRRAAYALWSVRAHRFQVQIHLWATGVAQGSLTQRFLSPSSTTGTAAQADMSSNGSKKMPSEMRLGLSRTSDMRLN